MLLLIILDSLGTQELLFILIVALIFFGPRKLPQISRQIGKSLAEFRKASEDFKRTWEREVALESEQDSNRPIFPATDSTIAGTVERNQNIDSAGAGAGAAASTENLIEASATNETLNASSVNGPTALETSRKRDWL
jgi:Tat protein translocase TatB subunit